MTDDQEPESDNDERDEGAVTMPEAIRDMFTNPDFLKSADGWVDKITAAIKDRNQGLSEWAKINRLFLWQRFVLSLAAMAGLALAGAYRVVEPGMMGALMAAVVASLFVVPKKD